VADKKKSCSRAHAQQQKALFIIRVIVIEELNGKPILVVMRDSTAA
jgi:hypothetical protein